MAELSFKILIIGDKEVGRTTLLEKQFKMHTNTKSGLDVVGVNLYAMILTLERRDIRLTIWYISSAERFDSVLPNFIKGTHGAVLMFDLTNCSTLNYLSKFPELIREGVGDIPILLVGNKIDLEEGRKVSEEEGEKFMRKHHLMEYLEISANSGQNCEGIFKLLTENILKHKKLD